MSRRFYTRKENQDRKAVRLGTPEGDAFLRQIGRAAVDRIQAYPDMTGEPTPPLKLDAAGNPLLDLISNPSIHIQPKEHKTMTDTLPNAAVSLGHSAVRALFPKGLIPVGTRASMAITELKGDLILSIWPDESSSRKVCEGSQTAYLLINPEVVKGAAGLDVFGKTDAVAIADGDGSLTLRLKATSTKRLVKRGKYKDALKAAPEIAQEEMVTGLTQANIDSLRHALSNANHFAELVGAKLSIDTVTGRVGARIEQTL